MKTRFLLAFALLCGHIQLPSSHGDIMGDCGVTVVLVGATGDLARRYLWPALFSTFSEHTGECMLTIFGGSRKLSTNENDTWSLVTSNVNCEFNDTTCEQFLGEFRLATKFVQLAREEDYIHLHSLILSEYDILNVTEHGRIFYLSVPPSAYTSIIRNVDVHARPVGGAWLRVALEKPFGRDLASAKLLAGEVSKHLMEEEVYRVDHYLGKSGVEQILPFRRKTIDVLSPYWNRNHIQQVEVVMKERLDVKGRTSFYNENGVIRDVLQNHLTEILARLIMALPENGEMSESEFLKAKMEVLSEIYSPCLHHALLGQYADYQSHLVEDGVIGSHGNSSSVPTYASVALFSRDPAMSGVPFVLLAGKQLNERTAYARVTFQDHWISVQNMSEWNPSCPPQIMFMIQDDQVKVPGVMVSEHLLVAMGLHHSDVIGWEVDILSYPSGIGENSCKYVYYHRSKDFEYNAYVSIIGAVLKGRKDYFVDTASLLESWRIWTPLLKEIDHTHPLNLKLYSPGDLGGLDFHLRGTSIVPIGERHMIHPAHTFLPYSNTVFTSTTGDIDSEWSALFGHNTYVVSRCKMASMVAEDLYLAASGSVKEKGSFHLALPGGKSLTLLYDTLSLDYHLSFPWQHIHIWQTDERCVKPGNIHSNMYQLSEYVLSNVPIPFHNVHPLQTNLQNGVCSEGDNATSLYEREIKEHMNNTQLDYIILGVGSDGHIGSLFPSSAVIHTAGNLVKMVMLNSSYPVMISRRLSLSYELITLARKVTLLLTGEKKAWLLGRMAECLKLNEDCDLPVIKLIKTAEKIQLDLKIYVDSGIVIQFD